MPLFSCLLAYLSAQSCPAEARLSPLLSVTAKYEKVKRWYFLFCFYTRRASQQFYIFIFLYASLGRVAKLKFLFGIFNFTLEMLPIFNRYPRMWCAFLYNICYQLLQKYRSVYICIFSNAKRKKNAIACNLEIILSALIIKNTYKNRI